MGASLSSNAGNSTFGHEQVFDGSSRPVRALAAVMRKLHDLYPKKFNANVAVRAGVGTRAVDYWTTKNPAERRTMSAEAFVSLLLDDDGGKILDAMMKSIPVKERPAWWLRHENVARMAEIERLVAETDEEVRQLRLSLLK